MGQLGASIVANGLVYFVLVLLLIFVWLFLGGPVVAVVVVDNNDDDVMVKSFPPFFYPFPNINSTFAQNIAYVLLTAACYGAATALLGMVLSCCRETSDEDYAQVTAT